METIIATDSIIDKITIEGEEEEVLTGIIIIIVIITILTIIINPKIVLHLTIKDLFLFLDQKVHQEGKIFNKIKVERLIIRNHHQDLSQNHPLEIQG